MAEQRAGGCTPGPWAYSPTGTPEYARQYAVYEEAAGRTVALVYDGEQAEANARVVAAGPELVEALQGLLALRMPATSEHDAARQIARALLARIEGRG